MTARTAETVIHTDGDCMDEKVIWFFLIDKIGNPFGAAGVMGNLLAESALLPNNLQNKYETLLEMTDEEYTKAVEDGTYTKNDFVNDGAGYGLCQWTHWSRKKELYEFLKSRVLPIDNLDGQLGFMWSEVQRIPGLETALKCAKSVREASDAFMLNFEKPADQSEANRETRAAYGQRFYDQFVERKARELTIYKRLFYNSDCYKAGTRIFPGGVQVHSTGANNPYLKRYVQPDDGRLGTNPNGNDHNQPGGNVCASAYIGKLEDGTVAVYETPPWDYKCWLSGSGSKGNANNLRYIGFEVCEDNLHDREYFDDAVMDKAVLLTAYLCQEFNIGLENIHDHSELHDMGLASNHADISHWLKNFGLNMDDFRAAVASAIEDGVDVVYIDCDDEKGLFDAKAVNPGTYLNLRSGPGTKYASIAKIPQGAIVMVLDISNPEWWRVSYQGQKGYAMSKYLERLDDPPAPEPEPEPEPEPQPQGKVKLELSDATITELYNAIMESGFCPDARSGNISNINYQ